MLNGGSQARPAAGGQVFDLEHLPGRVGRGDHHRRLAPCSEIEERTIHLGHLQKVKVQGLAGLVQVTNERESWGPRWEPWPPASSLGTAGTGSVFDEKKEGRRKEQS